MPIQVYPSDVSVPTGFRNIFINGGMNVRQRGSSNGVTANAINFGADRWYAYPVGANVTIHANSPGGPDGVSGNATVIQGNTSVTAVNYGQRIESYAANPLYGRTVTLSAYIYNSTGATFQPTFAIYAPTAADNWSGQVTIQATTNFDQSVPVGSWSRVSKTITLPSSANIRYGLSVDITFPTAAVNANTKYVYITGIQLELGATATPFEFRPYGTELALCQRYYERGNVKGYANMLHGGTNTAVIRNIYFHVPKRTTPTMGTVSIANQDNYTANGTPWPVTATSVDLAGHWSSASNTGFYYNAIDLVWEANAEL